MKYAKIENDVVIEVAFCSHDPIDMIECNDSVTVGYHYIDGVFIKPFSLAKMEKIQALKKWHDAQTEAMKSKYSQAEIDSFLDKRTEAMSWRADNTAKTPYVDAMSGGDPTARAALLNAILAKVDAAAQLEAYVLMLRDSVEAATTQEELDAIAW